MRTTLFKCSIAKTIAVPIYTTVHDKYGDKVLRLQCTHGKITMQLVRILIVF